MLFIKIKVHDPSYLGNIILFRPFSLLTVIKTYLAIRVRSKLNSCVFIGLNNYDSNLPLTDLYCSMYFQN